MSHDRCNTLQALLEVDLLEYMDDSTPKGFAAKQLKSSILKKNTDSRASDADLKAKELFMEMNQHCKDYRLSLNSEHVVETFGTMRDILHSFVHKNAFDSQFTYSLSSIYEFADFGPGASRGTRHTSYIGKICDCRLTATHPDLFDLYNVYTKLSVRSNLAELARRRRFGGCTVVKGSKFSTVPKSREIDRGIATEPLLNMFFQKGLAGCLGRALHIKTGLDSRRKPKEEDSQLHLRPEFRADVETSESPIYQQDKARALAKIGSTDGSFATIDLKSASDTLSLRLLYALFPSDFCLLISSFRSKYVEVDGKDHKLYMIASMGCGFTFNLQTMIFTALVLACFKTLGIKPLYPRGRGLGNFSVFGDDIIVPSQAYNFVIEMLGVIGTIPNVKKSFSKESGDFRESCGGDYLKGLDVRGVYNKSVYVPHYIYSTINYLVIWSARHQIYMPLTIGYLTSLVRHTEVPIEGFMSSDGIFSPQPKPVRRTKNASHVYVVARKQVQTISAKRFEGSPDASLQAFLKGTLRDGKFAQRLKTEQVRYQKVSVVVPNPGYVSETTADKVLRGVPVPVWQQTWYWYW